MAVGGMRADGAAIPQVPGTPGAVSQVGPTPTSQAEQNLFDIAEGRQPAPTNRGPYVTGYIGREANRVAQLRAETLGALQDRGGSAYVFVGASDKASTSFKTLDQMVSEFEHASNKEKKKMAKLLAMAGYLDVAYAENLQETVESATLMDVTEAYVNLLSSAAARFAQGQTIRPEDLLEMNIRYNMDQAGFDVDDVEFDADDWYDAATEDQKPHTEVTKATSTDIWNPEDARGLARNTLQQVLGRDPTEDEYEDFVSALQAKQRANPVTTTTRTRYDAQGNVVSVNETSRGGLSEYAVQDFAQRQAESAPDWAEWQAVGTYFPAAMSLLGSVVPNG